MRRPRPRSLERLAAVPTPRLGPKQLVLRSKRRVGGEPGADAIDRPPVHQMPVPRHQEDSQALRDQPKASPAADGAPRTRGSLPQTINQPSGPGPQDLPLFAAASADRKQKGASHQMWASWAAGAYRSSPDLVAGTFSGESTGTIFPNMWPPTASCCQVPA